MVSPIMRNCFSVRFTRDCATRAICVSFPFNHTQCDAAPLSVDPLWASGLIGSPRLLLGSTSNQPQYEIFRWQKQISYKLSLLLLCCGLEVWMGFFAHKELQKEILFLLTIRTPATTVLIEILETPTAPAPPPSDTRHVPVALLFLGANTFHAYCKMRKWKNHHLFDA